MNAIYITREGHRWELEDLVPSLFFPGFLCGRRKDTGALVQVHEHRLCPAEPSCPAGQPCEQSTANPS